MNWRGGSREDPGPRKRCSWGLCRILGHPLFLLHHVEVLAKVRGHVPLSQVLWIVLIHSGRNTALCAGPWSGVVRSPLQPGVTVHRTVLPAPAESKQSKGLFLHICPAAFHDSASAWPKHQSPARGRPNWPTRHSHGGWCLLVASQARGGPPPPTLPPTKGSLSLTTVQLNKATISSDKLSRY